MLVRNATFCVCKYAIAFAIMVFYSMPAQAQYSPKSLNISGQLFMPTTGLPVTNTSVNFRLEIWDKNNTCKLFEETHSAQNLSTTKGGFSLPLGEGTPSTNYVFGGADLTWHVFANPGAPATTVTGCPGGVVLNQGDNRQIKVFYDLGGGMTELTPGVPIESSAYAMIADTIQGRGLNDLIVVRDDVGTDLTQSNVENIFSASNYAKLVQLLTNTLSASYSFNNQTITNVGTPTAGGDAVNKTYADTRLAGSNLNTTGVASGNTLIWNGSAWMVGTPSATDNTKLPLAGGIMSGPLTLQHAMLGKFSNAQEGALTLGAGDAGRIFYNTDTNQLRLWNGSTYFPFGSGAPTGVAGGDLTGTYPNPTINVGTVTTAKIANDALTADKVDNAGAGINRIVMSDSVNPQLLRFKTCALNQILQWGGTGWACVDVGAALPTTGIAAGVYGSATTVSRIGLNAQGVATLAQNVAIAFPVTSVAGKTGAVTLNPLDVGVTGTAALYNVGDLSGELPMVQTNGKLSPGVIPTLGIGDISGAITQIVASSPITGGGTSGVITIGIDPNLTSAAMLRGNAVLAGVPADNQVLTWNATGARWEARAPGAGADNLGSHIAAQNVQLNGFWLTNDGVGNDGIRIDNSGNVGVGTTGNATAVLDVWGAAANSAMIVPRDTQGNRPAGTNGMIRYNTSTSRMEVFENGGWTDVVQTFTDTGIVTLTGTNGALVAGPATVKTISIDTGVTTGQIVQVDSGNRLPVIDGSQLTQISNLRNVNVSTTAPTGGQVLRYNGSAWEAFTLVDNAGVTFVAMGSGMVPGNISATGTISVDVGTGANQIVQLDGSSRIPAVNGSLLTNVNAVQLQSNNVLSGVPADNQVLTWNSTGARWEPRAVTGDGGIITLTGVNGALVTGTATVKTIGIDTGVTTGQIVQVDSGNRLPVIDGSQLTGISNLRGVNVATTAPAANQVLKYNGTGWAPMADTGMDVAAGTAILLSGPATLKTISVDVGIGANQIPQLNANGFLGIGTASVTTGAVADFWGASTNDSAVVMPRATTANRPATGVNGMIRYNTSLAKFEVYENGNWANMVSSGADNLGNHIATTNIQLGNNWLGFDGTNGEGIRVDTNGNVGIGTATPVSKLMVASTSSGTPTFGNAVLTLQDDAGGIGSFPNLAFIGNNNAAATGGLVFTEQGSALTFGALQYNLNSNKMSFTTGTLERVAIDGSGRIGMGTTSPNVGSILDLNGTGNLSSLLVPRGTTAERAAAPANGMIRYNTNTAKFEAYENNQWVNMVASGSGTPGGANTQIQFNNAGAFGGSANLTWNNSAGWLGIGTNSPIARLDVADGDIRIAQSQYLRFGTGGSDTTIRVDPAQTFDIYHNGAGPFTLANTGGSADMIVHNWGSGDVALKAGFNGAEILLKNNGSVGVGTNAPVAGTILDLRGTGNLSSLLVPRGTTAERAVAAANGMIRYNTNLSAFEVYQNNTWATVSTSATPGDNLGNHTATTAILAVTGTAATPSYTFTGDTNTGIYNAGADQFAITTNGTERIRVDNNGNVGIGTSQPYAPLHVYAPTAAMRFASTDNGVSTYIRYEAQDTGGIYKDAYAGFAPVPGVNQSYFYFSNGSVDLLTMRMNGSVGVGTSNPNSASILDVNGTGSQSSMIIPRGTTAERAVTAANGMIRYNTNTAKFEAYENNQWTNMISSGSGTPGGATTQIQYNNGGAFAGSPNLTWNNSAGWLGVGAAATSPLTVDRTAATANYAATLTNTTAANWGIGTGLRITGESGLHMAGIQATWDGNNTGTTLSFENRQSSATVTGMKLTSQGNINGRPGLWIGDEPVGGVFNGRINTFATSTGGNSVINGLVLSHVDSDSAASNNIGNQILFVSETAAANTNSETAGISAVLDDATDNSKDGSLRFATIGPNAITANTTATEKMRINSFGDVGIGTTNPGYRLDMYGSGWVDTRVNNGTGQLVTTVESTSSTASFDVAAYPLLFKMGGNEKMRIAQAGQVGIGTNSPNAGAILDLTGTGNMSSVLLPRGTTAERAVAAANGMIRYNTNTSAFEVYANNQWANIATGSGGGASLSSLTAATGSNSINNGANAQTWAWNSLTTGDALTLSTSSITSGDLLSLNSTNAAAGATGNLINLDVSGGSSNVVPLLITRSAGNPQPLIKAVSTSQSAHIEIQNTNAFSWSALAFRTHLGSQAGWVGYGNSSAATQTDQIYIETAGNREIGFWTNNASRMVINGSGLVGIGTTSPNAGSILDLNGTGNLSSLLIPRGTTAQRAVAAANGMIRYNTNTAKFEAYENNQWTNMISSGGGATAIDGLTDAYANYGADHNMFMGSGAGTSIAGGGQYNISIGENSSNALTTGDQNTAVGYGSMNQITTASFNTAFGYLTMGNGAVTGSNNTAMGSGAMFWGVTGNHNTAVGVSAIGNGASGDYNTAVGSGALNGVSSGNSNTALGHAAGTSFNTGAGNTAIGRNTLLANTAGNNNVALGTGANQTATSGSDNIMLGYLAGYNHTSGSTNIIIGANIDAPSLTGSNQLNIANMIYGTGVNNTTGSTVSGGRIGIGTNAPSLGAVLEVLGTGNLSSMIVPRGTTVERAAAGINGMIRYNTNTSAFEVYANNQWANVATGSGSSQWTTVAGNEIHYSTANVGIGTNDPMSPLSVGNGATTTAIFGQGSTGISLQHNWPNIGFNFYDIGGNKAMAGGYSGGIGINPTNGTMLFYNTNTSSGADAAITMYDRMAIDATGRVGIGTSAPGSLLHIDSSTDSAIGTISTSFSGGVSQLLLSNTAAGGTNWAMSAGNSSTGGGLGGNFGISEGSNYRLIVAQGGSVGIGTTAPNSGSILDLNGTGNLSSVLVPRGTTAERAATPANGMIRYNTNTAKFEAYENNQWTNMIGSGSSQWTTSGSNIYYNTGNVGIGTATPTQKLHIEDSASAGTPNLLIGNAGQTAVQLGDSNSGAGIATGYLTLGNAGTTQVAVAASGTSYFNGGNVGIGTASPSEKLEIVGTGYVRAVVRTTGPAGDRAYLNLETSSLVGVLEAEENGTGSALNLQVYSNHDLKFSTNNTDRVRIKASGNVGIGTTSPNVGSVLDLYGTGNLSSLLVPRGTTAERAATPANGMIRYNTNTAKFEVYETQWKDMIGSGGGGGTPGGATTQVQFNNAGSFGGSPNLTWNNSAGWLGIGTTSAAGMLHVYNGNIHLEDGYSVMAGTSKLIGRAGNDARVAEGPWNAWSIGMVADSNQSGTLRTTTTGYGQVSMHFELNGAERMRIDTTGRVGIGTTTATATLDVAGTARMLSSIEGVATSVNSGANYTIPDTTRNVRRITLNNNTTITLPSGASIPADTAYSLTVRVTQDATGNRTLTWAAPGGHTIKWDQGAAPAVANAATQETMYQFTIIGGETTWYAQMVWREN